MGEYFVYGLYKDEKIFYVGITNNLKNRLSAHKRIYGKEIVIKVLDTYIGNEDTALALESFWIKKIRDSGVDLENIRYNGEPRKIRSYKCIDEVYRRAMDRAKREGTTLCELIEKWVTMYANNESIIIFSEDGAEVFNQSI